MTEKPDGLKCLRFYLRHSTDMQLLSEDGPQERGSAGARDWRKFERVRDLAWAQGGALLNDLLELAQEELAALPIRFGSTARPTTAGRRWEAWTGLKLPRAREPFAFVGLNLGFTSPWGAGIHVYLGHTSQRHIHGPALGERLRRAGGRVLVADRRSDFHDWARGTVLLGQSPLAEHATREALGSFVSETVRTQLVANWHHVPNPARSSP